jgi:gamma-glutamyltranspeptidase
LTGHTAGRLGIATPQRLASEVGAAAFTSGGNAIDAALAAALSLTVCYPDNCALGGDLIAIVRTVDGETMVVNASGPAAMAVDVATLRARGDRMPVYGADAVTVPGLIAGLHALWSLGARRAWSAAFGPAIEQATDGVAVPPSLAASLQVNGSLINADPGLRGVFAPGGRLLAAGEILRQPALAGSLQALASGGPDAFYAGELGRSVIAFLRSQGSALTEDDLAAFTVDRAEPLAVDLRGARLLTAPPNSQGFLLPLIVRAIETLDDDLDPLGADAGLLARIFQRAVEDRTRLGDPGFVDVPLDEFISADRLRTVLAAPVPEPTANVTANGDTVAIVTADDEGNCVSLIQSLFHSFGAGLLDPETGIICHNRGAYFSLDADSPNVIAPGKRPVHTLMPALVLEDDRPTVVLGTMGGSGQPQILAQILSRLHLGSDAREAVDAPRWVYGGMEVDSPPDEVLYESRVPDVARESLERTGFPCRELTAYDENVGHAQLITVGADGELVAASDPRSEGAAIVVER